MCTHMLAYLYHSGPHADFNTHVATVRGRLTLTAAFSGTQGKNVAFWPKSLPTHGVDVMLCNVAIGICSAGGNHSSCYTA